MSRDKEVRIPESALSHIGEIRGGFNRPATRRAPSGYDLHADTDMTGIGEISPTTRGGPPRIK